MLVSGVGGWGCISCELLSEGKDPGWRERGRDRGRERRAGERGEKRSKEQRQALGSMASIVPRGWGAWEVLVSLIIL